MRVLWMRSDDVFPPDTASRRRAHGVLRALCARADVTFLYLQTPEHGMASRGPDFDVRRVAVVRPTSSGTALGNAASWLRARVSRKPPEVLRVELPAFREAQRRFVAEGGGAIVLCDGLAMRGNVEWTLPAVRVLLELDAGAPATAGRTPRDAVGSDAFDLVFNATGESDEDAAARLHTECAALARSS